MINFVFAFKFSPSCAFIPPQQDVAVGRSIKQALQSGGLAKKTSIARSGKSESHPINWATRKDLAQDRSGVG